MQETLFEQMARMTAIRESDPEHAERIMAAGQEIIRLATVGDFDDFRLTVGTTKKVFQFQVFNP